MQIRQLNQQGIGIPSNNVSKFIHWPKDPKAQLGLCMSGSMPFAWMGTAGRREVAGRGQAQRAIAGAQRNDGLHRALAEQARANEGRALVILQRSAALEEKWPPSRLDQSVIE